MIITICKEKGEWKMNKTVTNCANCPLATKGEGKHHTIYFCIISEESLIIYHDEEQESKHAPKDCPLRSEQITISLTK